MNIAVLASHEGTTLQAIIDACADGHLDAQVVMVICNNRDAGALRRAALAGIPSSHLSGSTHPDPAALDLAISKTLIDAGAELVFLAGYLKRLGPITLATFAGALLNTHPSLLPKHGGLGFHGKNVHAAVLAAAEHETGATVHFVSGDYDTGAVIKQCRVPVLPGDTVDSLATRVQQAERVLVVETLAAIACGQLRPPGLRLGRRAVVVS
ncbi:MAG: phosphoribosylglycinamide formyltransferase [Gammaproteobacteria bacterium]|nr:phosphoribosylglycinamide formyltransferase [Gammaproteobacteria bacterium]